MRIDKLLKQLKWFNDFADKLEPRRSRYVFKILRVCRPKRKR